MIIELPYPPTVNHYYTVARGRKILSATGRAYKQTVAGICVVAMRGRKPLMGDVSLTLTLNPPDRRRRDADNLLKPVLDALTAGGVWGDDCQVKRLVVEMHEPVRGGYCQAVAQSL